MIIAVVVALDFCSTTILSTQPMPVCIMCFVYRYMRITENYGIAYATELKGNGTEREGEIHGAATKGKKKSIQTTEEATINHNIVSLIALAFSGCLSYPPHTQSYALELCTMLGEAVLFNNILTVVD